MYRIDNKPKSIINPTVTLIIYDNGKLLFSDILFFNDIFVFPHYWGEANHKYLLLKIAR